MSKQESTESAKNADGAKQLPEQNTNTAAGNAGGDQQRASTEVVSDGVKEIGGPKGLEPTRYGDWEAKGRCYDF